MSLDVTLKLPGAQQEQVARVMVRQDGAVRELPRDEWGDREYVAVIDSDPEEVYSANITHNLRTMASEAMLYNCIWRPDEHGLEMAEQLIPLLTVGLALLKSDPKRFKAFNAVNGWGKYENLVEFTENYLEACKLYPKALIHASR